MGEVKSRRFLLNVHSVTGNVGDMGLSVEFWRWKYCRKSGNIKEGRARLWDTVEMQLYDLAICCLLPILGISLAGIRRSFVLILPNIGS